MHGIAATRAVEGHLVLILEAEAAASRAAGVRASRASRAARVRDKGGKG